ncbi:hypothetical protein P4O66_020354 [Electrophorus voltai]|uniref:C-type lectin domain-containing protein n=1 Tax=Electrophorus voltai TaxID=2609070 RepID=A0AAD8ZSD6_9TELE|nr:hypothetical protein P4O66_020354 [Electrophorus voltai]
MVMWKVCLLLCLLLDTVHSNCPHQWTLYGRRCYRFFTSRLTWYEAECACVNNGGSLASVHSVAEYKFLQTLVKRVSGFLAVSWLGGYDAVSEGHWLWSDGSKVNFNYWVSNQPDNYNGMENCLEMNYGVELKLNDDVCSSRRSFMCVK